MKIKRQIAILLAILIIVALQVSAAPTTVTVPDINVKPDETVVIPIMVYDVTNVSGAYFKLGYNQSVVYVTDIGNSDLNLVTYESINNGTGQVAYALINWPDASDGSNIKLANVTLKAVGVHGDSCSLSLDVMSLQDDGYQEITRTIENGTVTVVSDLTPPSITSPLANPDVIPIDNDNNLTWGEISILNAEISDINEIKSVTIDLSPLGGSETQQMTNIESDTWVTEISAPNGSLPGVYRFLITAIDENGNSNTEVNVELNVAENGDVNRDGIVDLDDGVYLLNHVLLVEGYEEIDDSLADVTGDGAVILDDGMYLVNHVYGIEGYETLH